MLNSQKKHEKYSLVLLPTLLRKKRQRQSVNYDVIDELQCFSLKNSSRRYVIN